MNVKRPVCILGLSGIPRIGSTDFIIREALNYAKSKLEVIEIDYFSAKGKKINFCIHCDHCFRTKEGCIFDDFIVSKRAKKSGIVAFGLGLPGWVIGFVGLIGFWCIGLYPYIICYRPYPSSLYILICLAIFLVCQTVFGIFLFVRALKVRDFNIKSPSMPSSPILPLQQLGHPCPQCNKTFK